MIKIGEKSLSTTVNDEAKAKLAASTGLSVEEVVAQLVRGGGTAHIARALLPFLKDPMPLAELATLVDADAAGVASQLVVLLAKAAEPVAPGGKATA
jgi:hypothetical protein